MAVYKKRPGLNSAQAGKGNKTRPTSYTVMDFEMLYILKIKFSTYLSNKKNATLKFNKILQIKINKNKLE
jgi:hypothetical protein